MAKNKVQKAVTKKHLARLDRERRQTRLITGIAIGVIVLVILGIAYGFLNDTLFLNWRSAVSVNGQSLSMHEFQVRAKVTRQQLINQYMQYIQLAQMFGMDPTTDPQMSQTLNQITTELNTPSTLGGQVIDAMVDDLLIRQYAKANGITVSAAEIENAAQAALRYYPKGTPSPTLTPTQVVYATLDATQLALVSPTPLPTSTATETSTPTGTAAPTDTPTPTATTGSTATSTPIPSPTATATPYTQKGYKAQYDSTLKTYSALGMDSAEFRNIFFESGLYRDRVQAKITAAITDHQEQVWARHILVADEATAKDILKQLAAGTDFATLAAKYSTDTGSKDKGGDLGWFARGAMVMEFEKAAFSLKVGETSQPVKSQYGYHIIQVLGHETRPLTASEYQTAVTTAFTTWLQSQRANSKVVISPVWGNYVPSTPTIAQAQSDQLLTATSYFATAQAQSSGK